MQLSIYAAWFHQCNAGVSCEEYNITWHKRKHWSLQNQFCNRQRQWNVRSCLLGQLFFCGYWWEHWQNRCSHNCIMLVFWRKGVQRRATVTILWSPHHWRHIWETRRTVSAVFTETTFSQMGLLLWQERLMSRLNDVFSKYMDRIVSATTACFALGSVVS